MNINSELSSLIETLVTRSINQHLNRFHFKVSIYHKNYHPKTEMFHLFGGYLIIFCTIKIISIQKQANNKGIQVDIKNSTTKSCTLLIASNCKPYPKSIFFLNKKIFGSLPIYHKLKIYIRKCIYLKIDSAIRKYFLTLKIRLYKKTRKTQLKSI